MQLFLLKVYFLQSFVVFIQRFHKVAMLHQSIIQIRAGARGEGTCEFSGMRKVSSTLRQATCHIIKGAHKLLFLPFPS